MSKKPFKILLLGDIHGGHKAGLTPPAWQLKDDRNKRVAQLQKEMWKEYRHVLRKIGEVDLCICNGDAVEGSGCRSSGIELITTDLDEQVEIARRCLDAVPTDNYMFTYGTASHTSEMVDWEKRLAGFFESPIKSNLFIKKYGVTMSIKHHIASSGVPYSRHGAVAKDRLWNVLWHDIDQAPLADVFIRSHCHYFQYAGTDRYLGMTLPALQCPNTHYGARRCQATVDWGVVEFTIDSNGEYSFKPHIVRLENVKEKPIEC